MEFSDKNKMTFTRGDDDSFLIGLKDGRTFEEGDAAYFSVKATEDATDDIFQIESTTFVPYEVDGVEVEDAGIFIEIPHASTIGMALGRYYYDILIVWADGSKNTVVRPTRFTLEAGGSHAGV